MTDRLINEYQPDVVTPPGVTLEETLKAIGMSNAELANRIGKTPKHIGAIIKHGAPITPDTAIGLEKALGIPASFWNNRERNYQDSLARQKERLHLENQVDWLDTFPVREMVNAGWMRKFEDKVEQLKEVLAYFGVTSPEQWKRLWLSQRAAYRRSKAFESNPEACAAWLRKGELEAQQIECGLFNKDTFRTQLRSIRKLTREEPEEFESKAVQLCAEVGVALVFIPPIKGVPVYGATRWLTPNKAFIQFSLRGHWEDFLWFTFFHEAGHIYLHGKRDVFLEVGGSEDEREKEADRFARDFLISSTDYRRFIKSNRYRSQRGVTDFASELEISPAIVVGRLQHDRLLPRTHLNKLRRRFVFDDPTE